MEMKDQTVTYEEVSILPNPGLLDSEWIMPKGFRYLLTLEKPLSYEQMELLAKLVLQMKDDRGMHNYCRECGITYRKAHVPKPIDEEGL